MRLLAEGDAVKRLQTVGQGEEEMEMDEAAGFTNFVTEVAQRVSKTMRALEPVSAIDAARWVDYWVSAGMFSEGV